MKNYIKSFGRFVLRENLDESGFSRKDKSNKKKHKFQSTKNETVLNDILNNFPDIFHMEGEYDPESWFRSKNLLPSENEQDKTITDFAGFSLIYSYDSDTYKLSIPSKINNYTKYEMLKYIKQNFTFINLVEGRIAYDIEFKIR